MRIERTVPGFLPSTCGFHFDNHFDHVPDLKVNVLGQTIGVGDAENGLCGGMAFAARDFFEAGASVPPVSTPPSSGALFDYFVKRLFDSFNLDLPPPPSPPFGGFHTPTPPFGPGPLTYMHLMNPALPDHETTFSNAGLAFRGRAWVMIQEEWPKVKADIDNGRLSPLALVRIKSANPGDLGHNHQVLAYGYILDGSKLTLRYYDPNYHHDDGMSLSLDLADPQHTTEVSPTAVCYCFFRPLYTPSVPPSFTVPWESLGGVLTSAPCLSSWASGRLDLFGRGTDNTVYHRYWDGNAWIPWAQLDPRPVASAPAAVSWGPNRIDLFVRGTDDTLQHKWWDGNRWSSYESLGGVLTSAPAVCSWASGRLDVFVRGTDNALYHKWWDGRWNGWEQLEGTPLGSGPAAVSWGPNRIDVFARGADNTLCHKWWNGNSWSGYESLGGNLTSGPTVCSWEAGRLDIFVRGTDNAVWRKWFDGAWSRWQQQGANPITGEPAAVCWGRNRIDLVARGTDDVTYHRWWDEGWHP